MLRLESPPSTQSGPSCSGVRCLVFIQTEAVGPGRRPGSAERQRGLRTRRVDYNGHPEHNALRATSGTDLFRVQRGRGRLS